MKHNYLRSIFCTVFASLFFIYTSAQRSNCPALPIVNELKQPDGTSISLIGVGNEAIHYLETQEGYTVLKNQEGVYEFAIPDQNGNLTTSGIKAINGVLTKIEIPKHLRYSAAQQSLMLQLFEEENRTSEGYGKAGNPNPFPPKGDRKVIVILVEYPDLRATVSKENFELLLNQPDYNGTGSFKDYYKAASNGQLNLTSIVYGWVMADSGYKYYGRNSSPSYNAATRSLLLGAVRDANDSFGVDFSEFDSDDDGYCDGVIVMHAGIGAEEVSAPNSGDYIWSFRSTLSETQRPTYDGVQIASFAMFPEKRWQSGSNNIVGIGVLCHEFGHLLDLPDLYSTQNTNEGSGNFTLMAGGPWLNNERTPCNNDAWSRIQMGWVTPTIIKDTQLYKLPYAVVDSDMVYQINTSRPNEYYLLENRQQKKFDAYLPARGLAIWHINTNNALLLSKATGNKRNNVNNDTSQLGVGLIQ
ncbi:MAG: M6 family metalloprotease domain-containing protein, partial [Bacteroidetes bacterium]